MSDSKIYEVRRRPCDSVEFFEVPNNAFGQRLGSRLRDIFCDLDNEEEVAALSKETKLLIEELRNRLYVFNRYSSSDPNVPMNRFFNKLLGDTYPKAWGHTPDQWLDKIPQEDKENIKTLNQHERDFAQILLSGHGPQLIILVGGVGCGKTTFIHHFFNSIASQHDCLKKFVSIRADFRNDEIKRKYYSLPDDQGLDRVIDSSLTEYYTGHFDKLPKLSEIFKYTYETEGWEETYISLYDPEEQDKARRRLYQTWRKRLDEYNYSRVKYLQKEMGAEVILWIDNIDPWPKEEQRKLLLNVLNKQTWYGAKLLIAIREYTMGELSRQLNISAYRSFTKHLTTPLIHETLNRRLELLEQLMGNEDLAAYPIDAIYPFNLHFTSKQKVIEFLKMVILTFSELKTYEFIQGFSNHNLRRIFDFAEIFLSSGNTQVWRAFPEIVKEVGANTETATWENGHAKLHMTVNVAILNKGGFYHPSRDNSFILNLFCNESPAEFCNSLLRYRIVSYLVKIEKIPKGNLIEQLIQIGYDHEEINNAINKLALAGLIESIENVSDVAHCILFITRTGVYYIAELCWKLIYLQHMRDGTYLPYTDRPMDSHISLDKKILKTAEFVKFLSNEEIKERTYGIRQNQELYMLVCAGGSSIPKIAKKLCREIKNIKPKNEEDRNRANTILENIINRDKNSTQS